MRTLKYAILGLLNQKKMTGYDLMKQFESALCEFWSAKHSQIYPELKKLTEEGCVAYRQEASDNGLEKKLYHITEKGRTDFMSWLSSETPAQPTPKDISRLKIFFCSCLPKEERKFMLEEQVYRHTARLKHLQNNQQKFSQVPDSDSNEFGDYLVLMGAIMREEMMIEWLKKLDVHSLLRSARYWDGVFPTYFLKIRLK